MNEREGEWNEPEVNECYYDYGIYVIYKYILH